MANAPSLQDLPQQSREIRAMQKAERLLVHAIEAGARYVDVEMEAQKQMSKRVRNAAHENGTVFIRSYHDFTRKHYIDVMLEDAGWVEGKDWINEVELPGMPNKSEVGYADYVLYDDAHKPLAVIEAKRTCVDVSKGRQQAELYAEILGKKYGRKPAIFLTNGFETRIDDGTYPERRVATIYSKRDLERMFNLRTMRTSLKNVMVNKSIAGRRLYFFSRISA